MGVFRGVERVTIPCGQRNVLHQPQREVRLHGRSEESQYDIDFNRAALTLLTNARPNAMSWPVSSATCIAFSLVYPPALTRGRGNQVLRMKSFDYQWAVNGSDQYRI